VNARVSNINRQIPSLLTLLVVALSSLLMQGTAFALSSYSTAGPPKTLFQPTFDPADCRGCHGFTKSTSLRLSGPSTTLPPGTRTTTLRLLGGSSKTWTELNNGAVTGNQSFTVSLNTGLNNFNYCIFDAIKKQNCGSTTVTVQQRVNQNPVVTVDPSSLQLDIGGTSKITVQKSDPDNDPVTISTSSDNELVATVSNTPDGSGKYTITGVAAGSAEITFSGLDGKTGIDNATVSVTVKNNNGESGSISFAESEYWINEGDTVAVPLKRSNGSTGNVSVYVRIRGITATPGSDFQRANRDPNDFNATIRWANGEILDLVSGSEKSIDIKAVRDGLAGEGVESFEIVMVNIAGGSFGPITTATIYIQDQDSGGGSGTFAFEKSEYRIREGQSAAVAMIRSGGSSGDIVVGVKIRPVTASGGADFIRNDINSTDTDFNINARWDNGQVVDYVTGQPKTINIKSIADGLSGEGEEYLEIEMVNINGASLGGITKATVYIEDVVTDPDPTDYCVYPGGDTGKWGWDNVARKSCPPVSDETDNGTGDETDTGNCVYPAGDTSIWGWDNVARKSCHPVNNDTDNGSGDESDTGKGNCVYPAGDTSTWGWDNVARKSCPPNNDQPVNPFIPATNCLYPGGDTSMWGWDNVARISCPPTS